MISRSHKKKQEKKDKYQLKYVSNYTPLFHSVSVCPKIDMRWEMLIEFPVGIISHLGLWVKTYFHTEGS